MCVVFQDRQNDALRHWVHVAYIAKDLRSFFGLVQYLQKFIPQIATKTAILTALLPPNKTAEKAYELRKRQLAKGSPVGGTRHTKLDLELDNV